MDSSLKQAITKLAKGDLLRFEDARGRSIVLVQGMVWITQEDDPRDVFLSDGESFAFNRPGVALVQAISDTSLITLADESAGAIETTTTPPVSTEAYRGHGGLGVRIQLHRDLAARAQLAGVPARRA
jgi:Protein of unknown function (DUF2917)